MSDDFQQVYVVVPNRIGEEDPAVFAEQRDADAYAEALAGVFESATVYPLLVCEDELAQKMIVEARGEKIPDGICWPTKADCMDPPDGWSWVERDDEAFIYACDESAAEALIEAGIGTEWAYFKRNAPHLRLNPPAEPNGPGWSVAINVPEPAEPIQTPSN